MFNKGLLCVALLTFCGITHAKDCSPKSIACIEGNLKSKNAEMTSAYNALHDSTKAKTELEDSQSSWSTYRDKQCGEFISKNSSGATANVQSEACKLTITTERLQLLKSLGKAA
jgi:uncharacterized protein YecT (DUF1311 family)